MAWTKKAKWVAVAMAVGMAASWSTSALAENFEVTMKKTVAGASSEEKILMKFVDDKTARISKVVETGYLKEAFEENGVTTITPGLVVTGLELRIESAVQKIGSYKFNAKVRELTSMPEFQVGSNKYLKVQAPRVEERSVTQMFFLKAGDSMVVSEFDIDLDNGASSLAGSAPRKVTYGFAIKRID